MAGFSLGEALFDIGLDLTSFRTQLDHVKKLAANAGKSVQKSFEGQKGTLASLDIRINSLHDEIRLVKIGSNEYRRLARQIRKATGERLKADKALKGGGFLSGIGGQLAGAAAGAIGLGALTMGFKDAIQAAIELDTITKRLSATLGESGAQRALTFTKSLSDQLGLSFRETAKSFGKFTAAATAAQVPLQVQKDLFASVSKAGMVLGLSNDEMAGTFMALQQMASKGVVSMEELRQQMGERLPIAFAGASKGLGVTTKELISMVEAGKLTANELFPALTKGLNSLTETGGGLETAAQNFNRLSNAWGDLQEAFGTSILPEITKQVKNLTDVLEGMSIVGEQNDLGFGKGWLGSLFGQTAEGGQMARYVMKDLQKQYGLTWKEAEKLYKQAAKLEGASFVSGNLIAGEEKREKILQRVVITAKEYANTNKDSLATAKEQSAVDLKANEDRQKAIAETNLQKRRSLQSDASALTAQESRLAGYSKEIKVLGQIESVRSSASLDRSNTIKSLLGIEQNHAMKMARTDRERQVIAQNYGKAIFNQTVAEFNLKARGLIAEQQSQRTSLAFEQQRMAAANRRLLIEAKILLLTSQAEAADKPSDQAAQQKVKLARENLRMVQAEVAQSNVLFSKQAALLNLQQAAARERLGNERLIELAGKKEFATVEQRKQLQADINRMLRTQAGEADAAAVSANSFRENLRGAETARASLSSKFQATVTTTIDGNQTFTSMNDTLNAIEGHTKNAAKNPINIYMRMDSAGRVTSATSGTAP